MIAEILLNYRQFTPCPATVITSIPSGGPYFPHLDPVGTLSNPHQAATGAGTCLPPRGPVGTRAPYAKNSRQSQSWRQSSMSPAIHPNNLRKDADGDFRRGFSADVQANGGMDPRQGLLVYALR